jgi:hypothetical protein
VGFSTGRIAIAVCDRCNLKMAYNKLRADGDNPALRVCRDCRDVKDPYKLPARTLENYLLRFPRPDSTLTAGVTDATAGGIVYDLCFQENAFQDGAFQE